MTHLALLAMVLLTSAPTISRLLGAGPVFAAERWVELCTGHGLAKVQLPGQPAPSPAQPADHDCAYCPLLSSLSGPPAPLAPVLLPLAHSDAPPALVSATRAANPIHRGLGSRGPPSTLG